MTEQEEKEKLNYVQKHNSYTSPSIEDVDICNDDTYFWDCWNADYCSKYRKRNFKYSCLRGAKGNRCSHIKKEEIRTEALQKGFKFPNT